MVDMTTADGHQIRVPRAAIERVGIEVRPAPVSVAPEVGADGIPESLRRPAPAQTTGDPALDRFIGGLDAPPAPPAPHPQLSVPTPAPETDDAFSPSVGPTSGTDPRLASTVQSLMRPQPAHNPATPAPESQFVTLDGERVTAGQGLASAQGQPAHPRTRGRATSPAEPELSADEQLIDDLIARPEGEPLAPEDSRTSSPLDRALERVDRERQRQQGAAENLQAAAIDRERLAAEADAQQQELAARRAEAMNTATQAYAAAVQEARSSQVNPSRLFQNGGGISVAIATVLGSLGSALTGGPNTALDMINRAIDRDIQAQTTNQANAQRAAQNARGLIDITRERFSDEAAQIASARSLAMDQVAQRIERQAASLQSAAAQDHAAALAEQLRQQALQSARDAAIAEQTRLLEQRQAIADIRVREAEATQAERRAVGGGGSPSGRLSRQARLARQLEQAGVSRAAALQVAGLGGLPIDEDSELSGQERGNVAAAEEALARVEALVPAQGDIPGFGQIESAVPDAIAGEDARRLRQAVRQLVEIYGRLHSGGAISDQEFATFNRVIGSGRFQTETELRDGLRAVRQELGARRRGRGAAPSAATLPAGVRVVE